MEETVSRYLQSDHARIDEALQRAAMPEESIDPAPYLEFRGALLRHIGLEEKILLPAARFANGGKPVHGAERLHLDHGALAALLVPTPTKAIVRAIHTILERHNRIEEGPEGTYAECERLLELDAAAIIRRLKASPPVAMAPYSDSPVAMESMRAALHRAGYSFEL
jgi:hypothetical protein